MLRRMSSFEQTVWWLTQANANSRITVFTVLPFCLCSESTEMVPVVAVDVVVNNLLWNELCKCQVFCFSLPNVSMLCVVAGRVQFEPEEEWYPV